MRSAVSRRAEQRRELVEQPGLRADPLVLHARAQPRDSMPVERSSGRGRQALSSSSGCTRSPARASSARHSATSSAAEEDRPAPRGRSPPICRLAPGDRARVGQLGDGAAHERAPALDTRAVCQRERILLIEIDGMRTNAALGARLRCDDDALGDRERQRQAAVVVGVLADQVDAPRGERAGALRRHGRSPRAARRPTPRAACRR